MISLDEVKKLANLSRLKLSDEEMVRMQSEMTAILAYVDKLKAVAGKETGPVMSTNKNVLREDANPHAGDLYTDKLIKAAPKHQGRHVQVKKILGSSQ
jgi:aspartyl-tRNA(Asn)/glutamyl-tRNA(Gln) amidotransferase subunit C